MSDHNKDEEVLHPEHYSMFEIEPAEFIMKNELSFWQGNVIKYVSRAGRKTYTVSGEIEDCKKAVRYLEMRIKHQQDYLDTLD